MEYELLSYSVDSCVTNLSSPHQSPNLLHWCSSPCKDFIHRHLGVTSHRIQSNILLVKTHQSRTTADGAGISLSIGIISLASTKTKKRVNLSSQVLELLKLHSLVTAPVRATWLYLLSCWIQVVRLKARLRTARPTCFAEHQGSSWLLFALGEELWWALGAAAPHIKRGNWNVLELETDDWNLEMS